MNTTSIIESKQKLEEDIKSLVSGFKEEHNLTDIDIDVITHKIYMDGAVKSFCTTLDIIVTATVNESGTNIVIR